MPPDPIELRRIAHKLADVAATATLARFRQPDLATDSKGAGAFDPVTEADREAERAMRAVLTETRPEDAVLGEEFAPTSGRTGLTWVLDPIDGTRAYLAGAPTWGTLIAVADTNGPLFGIVDQPYTGERFEGGFGAARMTRGAQVTQLRTSAEDRLDRAILFTTFPEIGTPADRAAFGRVAERARLVRYGLDCYAYALLAAGHVDMVIEAGLQAHDIAAPMALIRAAGGVVSDWSGGAADRGGRVIAAANPALHAAALELLAATD